MKFLFFLTVLVATGHVLANWDEEYWQEANWQQVKEGPHKLYFKVQARFNHWSRFYYYQLTEGYAYQAHPNLGLEAHYSYIHDKPLGALSFTNAHRLELEVNPSMSLPYEAKILWRNRLEIIKREDDPVLRYVLRHRCMGVFPIKSCGALIAYRIHDEIFYNFTDHLFHQNRFVPIQLDFQVTPELEVDLYFMVRNFISSNKWRRSFVLGSAIQF